MVYLEGAEIINADDIKELMDEECTKPTIDRLVFIETKGIGQKGNTLGNVFPCFLEAYMYDESGDIPKMRILATIVHYAKGEFGMTRVQINEEELGVKFRFWDKPPKKGLRDDYPFPEEEVQ